MATVYKTPAGEQAIMARIDEALAAWPVSHETLTIPTRHGDTFVIASGDPANPPLILLHGAGANSCIWIGEIADYCRRYRVYAVDLLGEAGKSAQNRPPWNTPAYAEWLEDVLDALKIEKTAIVGMSQGSWTAIKFAVYQPGRVEKLALMCPGGIVADRISFLFKAIFYGLTGRQNMKKMNRLLYGDQPVPPGAEEIALLIMKHFKSRIGTLPIFTDEELKRLTMPVLVLGGEKDALRDHTKIGARLTKLLPNLRVEIIPGAGHALMNMSGCVMGFLTGDR